MIEKAYLRPVIKSPRELEKTKVTESELDKLCFFTEREIRENELAYDYIKR